jgi:hypothetical protein
MNHWGNEQANDDLGKMISAEESPCCVAPDNWTERPACKSRQITEALCEAGPGDSWHLH